MAAINFPSTTGQATDGSFKYTFANVTYYWDGEKWNKLMQRLGALGDVLLSTLSSGEVLRYNGTDWANAVLAYSDLSGTPTNVSTFTNDANYITALQAPIQTVNTYTGAVVLDADDIDDTSTTHKFATAAQLSLADSALQSGDNISELTNDSAFISSASIAVLTDVTLTSLASTEFLRYNGTAWVNTGLVSSDIPALATSKITSGTFDDARIAESNVTQHQAALSITESQISDLQTYALSTTVTEIDGNVDDLITLTGIAENTANLGTFTGSIITDSSTIKTALQELETAIAANTDADTVDGLHASQFLRSDTSDTMTGDLTVSGDVTITDTAADDTAGPEFSLYRNSASPADGDYLGQIRFDGKNDNGGDQLYAKITGKTSDVTLGTEDGLIETAVVKDGSQTIVSRQTGDALKLINGTGLEVSGNITVTGTVDGRDVAADGTKLDGIEASATADQTDAEIKTAYENNADTNAFTDADHTKLDGIADGATNVTNNNQLTNGAGYLISTDNIATADKVYVDESEDDNNAYNILFTDENPGGGNGYHTLQVDNNGLTFNPNLNVLGVERIAKPNLTPINLFRGAIVQSGYGIDIVSGNITIAGTVDGRDVATDGTKLDGIEASATADQTGAEIKALYEAETNAFTDAQFTKLAGIETAATADQTAAEILAALITVDGTGTNLDADLLDGQEGSYYAVAADLTETDTNTDDLVTLSGVAENATTLGTFTGETFTDNITIKAALQEIETALEGHLPVLVDAHNDSGATLSKGDVVYISGTHSSGKPTIALADANGSGTNPAIGLVNADIANGGEGYVIISGVLSNIDTSSYSAGQAVYLSETAGVLTTTRPSASTTQVQKIGLVTRVHASNGSLLLIGAGRSNDVPNEITTLTGVSLDALNLGTFTGTTITDDQTIKAALQLLETAVETKSDTSSLATVATTGAYSDLTGTPTNVSTFTNDSGYITGYTVTSGDVTTHEGDLTIAQSQVTNLTTDLAAKADLVGGVVPTSQIPSIAITEYLGTAVNATALVALTGQQGDWAIRTDTGSTWVITANNGSTLSDWVELATPADAVTSVNGASGVVVLDADDIDDSATTHKFATAAQLSAADSALQSGDNVSTLTNDSGYITATLTNEEVEDIVGGMVSTNTETGITVTYDDTNGKLDFSVASQTDENFTTADHSKLDGIEASATADQTGAEIKSLYEAEVNAFTDAQFTKLANIEASATADQTGAEIKSLYEAETNAFTDAQFTKLANIEVSATADQTGAEIKALYEAEVNAFTDAQFTKLDGIEASATADQTGAEIKALYEAEVNAFTDAQFTKLDGIESNATADQTDAEIRAAVAAATDSNVFTDADQTKLAGIETAATADQTDAEIRAAVAAATDSNVFTDAEQTKLAGIATGATNVTNNNQLTNGAGYITSADGGNAATLDSIDSTSFLRSDAADIKTSGNLTFNNNVRANFGTDGNLQIYNNGGQSRISQESGGDLNIRNKVADQHIMIQTDDGTGGGNITNYFRANGTTGEATLYHYGTEKISTKSGGVTVTGDIVVSGTVDGRDVATDGTKLDGIEAGATADQTKADIDALNIDADTLDGIDSGSFLRSNAADTFTGSLTSSARNNGIFGTYDSSKTDHIWSIGTAYKNSSTGADFGNLYGLAYKHTNNTTGGTMGGSHQMVWCINGTPAGAIGGDCVYHSTAMKVGSNTVWHAGNDGSGSGLDADTVDGIEASAFAQLSGATFTGDLTLDSNADLRVGDGAGNERILIQKADNNVSDHIIFYNGTTRMGEIGCQDTTWLRINNVTAKNIYTPRYIRADAGFYVDSTAKGINGSGNFIGGTITGASDANVSNWDTAFGWGDHSVEGYITSSGSCASATNATNFNVAADNSTNSTHYVTFTGGRTGNQRPNSDTALTYNPSSNTLTAGTFSGALSGNATSATTATSASNSTQLNGQAASYYLNYNNFTNTPTVPTNNNQLTNGAGYITSADGGNAGTLDGIDSSAFLRSNANDSASGTITFNGVVNIRSAIDLADSDVLRFGSGDDVEFFCNGSHMYTDLNSGIGNWYIRDGTTTRYTFNDNGSFTATGNVTAYSDINLKENIEVIPNALDKVEQLRGVTYNRKDLEDAPRHSGVIAQEVEVVLPEVVLTDEEGIKSVAYGNMVGLLIESIKELKSEVDSLKSEIKTLKGE